MKSTDSKNATLVRRIRRNRSRGETATNAHKPAHDPNRVGDCDPAGIVFYPRYFEWFDACAAALFEAAGFLRGDLAARQGMVIPMVDTRSRFLTPFRFGDELTVETAITRFGRSSFDVQHRILKGADSSVECSETRVWARIDLTGQEGLKSQPIPEAVIQSLSQNTK
jgi:4-hydroxybenzoyl-CoA thioesterase